MTEQGTSDTPAPVGRPEHAGSISRRDDDVRRRPGTRQKLSSEGSEMQDPELCQVTGTSHVAESFTGYREIEYYRSADGHAVATLTSFKVDRPPRRPGFARWVDARRPSKYEAEVRYSSTHLAGVDPRCEQLLWRCVAEIRDARLRLSARPQKIVASAIYLLIVYVFKAIEPVAPTAVSNGDGGKHDSRRVEACISVVGAQLAKMQKYVDSSARRTALRHYMIGLPVGIGIVVALARGTHEIERISPNLVDPAAWGPYLTEIRYFLALSILGGAIGAVLSVMIRITRGSRLFVDTDQSALVGISSGAFRPIIGAVSGAAMYALVKGHLLPFTPPADNRTAIFFFAGLAFVSGFSERWAQDTIVSSAPKVTNSPNTDAHAARER